MLPCQQKRGLYAFFQEGKSCKENALSDLVLKFLVGVFSFFQSGYNNLSPCGGKEKIAVFFVFLYNKS